MNQHPKKMVLALAAIALLSAPLAEAKRVGGGRSVGMQRSNTSMSQPQNTARPAASPSQLQQTPPNAPIAQQNRGPGVGGAVAAGVAGAAAGYMLGSALSDNGNEKEATANTTAATTNKAAEDTALKEQTPAAPAPATQESSGGIGFSTILLLLIAAGALFFFMRRRQPARANPLGNSANLGLPTGGNLNLRQGFDSSNAPRPVGIGSALSSTPSTAANFASGRLPDGTEVPHFLRQAKGTFLHVQSMNNAENVDEVRKYMTPELFAHLSAEISGNSEVADFPTLNCDLVQSEDQGDRYVASVRFHGLVSETVNSSPEPFSEIWHYVKSHDSGAKWILAGIQQD